MQKGFRFEEILDNNSNRKNHLLAIAINDYAFCPKLHNAVKDVENFIDLILDKFEFEEENITFLKDKYATKNNIIKHFRQLIKSLSANDNLIIYFSGHGEFDDIEDEGYWLTQEVRQGNHANYLPNSRIKKLISKIKAHHIFLISDSCFSGALFDRSTKSLHEVYERDASRWGLTSGRNEIVTDGKPGENSPFAKSLLYALRNTIEPLPILKLCQTVQDNTTVNANQSPRYERIDGSGHRGGQFVFRLKNDIDKYWQYTVKINTAKAYLAFEDKYPNSKYEQQINDKLHNAEEDKAWQKAKAARKLTEYRHYKKLYPKGRYVELANEAILELVMDMITKPKVEPPKIIIEDPFVNQMVKVKGGTFKMGSRYYKMAQPVHKVTVPTFSISKFVVTQKQWEAIMKDNHVPWFRGENRPVERIYWNDTQKFLKELNEKTGKNYRLPTEAEWEFAARGGTLSKGYKFAGSNQLDKVGWHYMNSRRHGLLHDNYGTQQVGTKLPNELGLYDMSGNVWEYCEDIWHETYQNAPTDGSAWLNNSDENRHVVRGGSWHFEENSCYVWVRMGRISLPNFHYGFRVVHDV